MGLFKSAPSAPPAPDPQATANAQTGSNIQTAVANARLNRVNQQTPWGSITYTQGPADANGVPTYSSQIQLSPAQQALLEQQNAMSQRRNAIAGDLLNQTGSRLAQPLDLSRLHPVYDQGQQYRGAVNAGGGGMSPGAGQQMPSMQPGSAPVVGGAQVGGSPAMQALMQTMQQAPSGAAPATGAAGNANAPAMAQLQQLLQNPQTRAMLMSMLGRP